MGNSKGIVSEILNQLGYKVPDEGRLQEAIEKGVRAEKKKRGVDPDKVKYKIVEIEQDWIRKMGR